MRKANNRKSSKDKSSVRRIKKISEFMSKTNSVYIVLYLFKENILKHKEAWENSIKYDDGYLQPYYKGLLTQIINKSNKILDFFKFNGFVLENKIIDEVEETIKKELVDSLEFEEKETEYTQNIMKSALKSLFYTVSFKKFHREYNKIKDLEPKLQEIIDVSVAYFNFFERDIINFEI